MNKLRAFVKKKREQGENIKIPRITRENDDFSNLKDDTEQLNADLIEDNGKLEIKKVEVRDYKSGFTYFSDGIERKKILLYYRSIPVIYGYVAAAIMKRADKKMRSIGLERVEENLYLPRKYFSEDDLGLDIIDTDRNEPMLPERFVYEAHREIQKKRGELERYLIKKWVEAGYNDGWLFVDGRLERLNRELTAGGNLAGIIKSHHVSYFDYEDQYKIYSMEKGERSGVFQPIGRDGRRENIFSWYLRLHYDQTHGTNDFGLVRIEVPAEEKFLRMADQISGWIMLETKPVAFPASRWDRMIYPVKFCEDYLKSKAPSYSRLSV